MFSRSSTLSLLLLISLAAAACRPGAAAPTTVTTPTFPPFPTLPPTYTFTAGPTASLPPTLSPTPDLSTATSSPDLTPASAGADKAEFVADVTVPDGADFAPNEKFTKTWRIKNAGTSTWTTAYVMEFVLGVNLATVNKVSFPKIVPPGGMVDLSVEMTAPSAAGQYGSLWQFRNPNGSQFGVGPKFNEAIYVQIDVVVGLNPNLTPASTQATPSGPLNPAKVTKVTLNVDQAEVKESCPHTFVFTAVLSIEGGGRVKYQLEASTTTAGFKFDLPAPLESSFNTNGPHTFSVAYTLEMRDTVSGQAWLHVLSPNELTSDKVSFSLTCPPKPTALPLATSTSGTPAATPEP